MKNNRNKGQKGIAQFLLIAIMGIIALGLPTATKLVQQNQENRSKAAENKIIPATGITMDLENSVYIGVGETLTMKYHLIPANSTDIVAWSVTKGSDVATVDADGIVKALKPGEASILGLTSTDRQFSIQDVIVTDKDVGKVDISYNLREENDHRMLTPGMDIIGELRLNTFGQSLSSAEIVYYHTEALDPYLDGVTGTELTKVVSHKKDGGWQKLKVEFDKSKKPVDSIYILKIKTKVTKYINNANLEIHKGLSLSNSTSEIGKTEILNTDNKKMNIGQVSGTNFSITNPKEISPTLTPKTKPTSIPTPSPIPTENNEISIFHNFAPKDYSIRKIGSTLINDIVIKTSNKNIDTATITYCYTDLLKPDLNSISGEQIAKVVYNKEVGNNCAEVKVIFNNKELNESFPAYENLKGYIISYKTNIIKYGRGMVKIDCSSTSLTDKNGEKIITEKYYCVENGTDFTLSNPLSTSPTYTPTTRPTSIPTRVLTPTISIKPTDGVQRPTPTLVIENDNRIVKTGKYIDISFYPNDLSYISDKNLNIWLERLNMAYKDYFELTNWKPFNGNKITIKSFKCNQSSSDYNENWACSYWAWADQTIGWNNTYIAEELRRVVEKNDWSFGILHEISHTFDNYDSWGGFDNEMMANFKMAYVLEKRNAKVQPDNDGKYLIGTNIIEIYKTNKDYGYDAILEKYRNGKTDELKQSIGNFLNYKFLNIKNEIGGWDTYKQVFKNLGNKKLNSDNTKINAFLDEMSIVSKKDVRKMFNQEEKAIMELKFGKIFPIKIDGKCNNSPNKCLTGTLKVLPSPKTQYLWLCSGSNGGKSVKCSTKQNTTRPSPAPQVTNIRISPLGLTLKIGQTRNLTYILSPSKTTDTIKWSTSGNGSVRIQKLTSKSSENNQLRVTGLKTGTVNITLTTNTGKSATAKVIIYK